MKEPQINIDPLLWDVLPDGRRVPSEVMTTLHEQDLLTSDQMRQVREWMAECADRAQITEADVAAAEKAHYELFPEAANAPRPTFLSVLAELDRWCADLAARLNRTPRTHALASYRSTLTSADEAVQEEMVSYVVDAQRVLTRFEKGMGEKMKYDATRGYPAAEWHLSQMATLVRTVISSGDLPNDCATPLMDLVRQAFELTMHLREASDQKQNTTIEWPDAIEALEAAMFTATSVLSEAYPLSDEWKSGAKRLGNLWSNWASAMNDAVLRGEVR